MGVALALQGQYERAKENYEKGLALTPDYPSLRNNYGLMQLARGDLQGALATFSALIASPGANDRYRLNRALVELALGQTAAALADAPGIDEPGLRQTLAIYWTPLRQNVSAPSGSSAAAPAIGAGDKSPLPSVHLAPDPAAVARQLQLEPIASFETVGTHQGIGGHPGVVYHEIIGDRTDPDGVDGSGRTIVSGEPVAVIMRVHQDGHRILADIVFADGALGTLFGFGKRGQQHGGKNGDDGNDDQQLDQGKCLFAHKEFFHQLKSSAAIIKWKLVWLADGGRNGVNHRSSRSMGYNFKR